MTTLDLVSFRQSTDRDDSPAFQRAVDAVAAKGGGTVSVAAGRYRLSSTVFLRSGVHVAGAGADRTTIVFDAISPDRMEVTPRLGILRSSAFVAAGRCPDDVYAPGSQELGDYYISAPRPLTGRIPAGSMDLPIAAEGLADVRVGDWLQLLEGHSGWHPAKSELVRVAGLSAAGVRLSTPTDNHYDGGSSGLGAFIARYDQTANPPGGARLDLWPHTGFRRVQPVERAGLSDMTIANINDVVGYGGRAYLFVRSIGCFARGVRVTSGSAWHLDSQDVECSLVLEGRNAPVPIVAMFNGSNRVRAVIRSQEGSLLIEEGVQRLVLERSSFTLSKANVVVGQYCAGITFRDVEISNAESFGISIYKSRDVRVGGSIVAAGSALRYDTPHPSADAASGPAVAPYFSGETIVLDHCTLRSTRNPGYDLWLQQPIRSVASTLAGDGGAPFLADGRGHGVRMVGSLIRRGDGRQFGDGRPAT